MGICSDSWLVGGGFIAAVSSSVFVAVFRPVYGITEILWLLAWVLSGIAILVGLVKGMSLGSKRVAGGDVDVEDGEL